MNSSNTLETQIKKHIVTCYDSTHLKLFSFRKIVYYLLKTQEGVINEFYVPTIKMSRNCTCKICFFFLVKLYLSQYLSTQNNELK